MKYFKTDGIRGIYSIDLNDDLIKRIGNSLKIFNVDSVFIGYDTRYSSKLIKDVLIDSIIDTGINCLILGVVTTPNLIYLSNKYKKLAVMITASHNKYYYNGLKIIKNGLKLSLEEELMIESSIDSKTFYKEDLKGKISYFKSDLYLNFLKSFKTKNKLKIIINNNFGSAYKILRKLFKNKYLMNIIPSGYNINLNDEKDLINLVKENNLDYAFLLDGDSDRLIVADKSNIYDGDMLSYVFLKYFNYKKIVVTKLCNLGIINKLIDESSLIYFSDVGDKLVLDKMNKTNSLIGSEKSGHIILKEFLNSSDGILNILILLKILNEKNLKDFFKDIYLYPNKLINLKSNINLLNLNEFIKNLENLYKDTYFYVRKSGTENCIRVFIQTKNKEDLNLIINSILNKFN